MKRQRLDIKRTIKKRIEHRHQSRIFLEKHLTSKADNKMNERDKKRFQPPKFIVPVNVDLVSRENRRAGKYELPQKNIFINYGQYSKKISVDYDAVICISSFNRYEKINRILNQIFSQETKYTFKFIFINDGSTDERYEELKNIYPDIIYLKNDIGGGKVGYWKTINTLWSKAKEINTHAIIQLDDDFILCDDFLNILLDKFFEVKSISNDYMVFSFHLYNFNKNTLIESFWFDENEIFVDGGMLIDVQFMEKINYVLDDIERRVTPKTSSFTWVRLKERIIEFGVKIYRFNNSLVFHDGNDDSKLHPNIRKIKRVYTKNFINDIDYEQ